MRTIRAGIFEQFDFNLTTICMSDFLEVQNKNVCSHITNMWPGGAGALLLFQVNGYRFSNCCLHLPHKTFKTITGRQN
jgi:hypothetical protein